jgi:DNA-binding winged helix-turn-helix (wHTH) protein/Tol biopolymer transport system component
MMTVNVLSLPPLHDAGSAFPSTGMLQVGAHRVDLGALRVISDDEPPVRLTLKSVQVLIQLARHQGVTVSRDQLLDTVWRGTLPTPEVVTQAIKELRRVFGDSRDTAEYIETIPKLGYRLIAEARFEDEPPRVDVAPETAAPAATEAAVDRPPPRREPRFGLALRRAAALAAVIGLGGAVVAFSTHAWSPRKTGPAWVAGAPWLVTTDPALELGPAISPDGTQVLYHVVDGAAQAGRVRLQNVTGSRALTVPQPAGSSDQYPSWSPAAGEIVFTRTQAQSCRILAMPALGGPARALGPCSADAVVRVDFSPDRQWLVGMAATFPGGASIGTGLARQPVGGGAAEPFPYPHTPGDIDLSPRFSPDGRLLAFRRGLLPYSDLYVMDVDAPDTLRRLTRFGSRVVGFDWTRDSRALVFSSDHGGEPALYAVDVGSGQIDALGIAPAVEPTLAREADVGAYRVPEHRFQFALLGADAPARLPAPSTTSDREAALSPDGRQIAFVSRRTGRDELWIHDLEHGDAYAVTALEAGVPRLPEWRADGGGVLFVLRGDGPGRAFEVALDTRRLTPRSPAALDVHYLSAAPDGRLYAVALADGEHGLYALEPDGKADLLEPGVAFARAGDAATGLVFNYLDRVGLYRWRGKDLQAERIGDAPYFRYEMPWALAGATAFQVVAEFPTRRVEAIDLVSGARRLVGQVDQGLGITAVSSDASGRQLLVWLLDRDGGDIAAFTFRPAVATEG